MRGACYPRCYPRTSRWPGHRGTELSGAHVILADVIGPTAPGRSAVFLLGEVEPRDLALFHAEEIRLRPTDPRSPRVEAIGHGIGYWVGSCSSSRVSAALRRGERILWLTLAAYSMQGGSPFRVSITNWVETRGTETFANMLGFRSPRYGNVQAWAADDRRNAALREAVAIARVAYRRPLHRLALRDLHAALLLPGADAFVLAFRAVEGIRQSVLPGSGGQKEWDAMHKRLGTTKESLEQLTELSTLVRHGKEHDAKVRTALRRPGTVLELARGVLVREFELLLGRPVTRLQQS